MKKSISVIALIFFLFSLMSLASDDTLKVKEWVKDTKGMPEYHPTEIIVKFKDTVNPQRAGNLARSINGTIKKKEFVLPFEVVELNEGTDPRDAVSYFKSLDEVEYAELNYKRKLHFTPNDPYYSYQWHMDNLNMESVWDITRGDSSVIVAVLDTGVAYENYGSFTKAPDLASTSFTAGYDFVDNDAHANDEGSDGFGHGTMVAGVIAQSTNNAYGVAGIAHWCTIMPVRVCSDGCYDSAIAGGIIWATNHGADVINMSLGGFGSSDTLYNACAYAYDAGVVVVASSGNEADEGDYPGDIGIPAAYSEVLGVGATRIDNQRSSYSNYGNSLDVVAPGGDMSVDQNSDGYNDGVLQQTFDGDPNDFGFYFADGTSFASPAAAALAALLMSLDSDLKGQPELIYDIIRFSATDLGNEGFDIYYGYGLINPVNALTGLGLLK